MAIRVSPNRVQFEGVRLNLARTTVASHATTADIWTVAGNQIDWTGTATTTAFPNAPQGGVERVLICAGASSFTAGANMLIDGVASASTVTCAANDQVIVRAVSTTQFKLSRVKYDGTAQVAASGALTLLSTVTASASATVDIETTFSSTYDAYLLVISNVVVSVDDVVLNIRFKLSGSYVTTATYLHKGQFGVSSGTAYTNYNAGSPGPVSQIRLGACGNGASSTLNARIAIYNPTETTTKKLIHFEGSSGQTNTDVNSFFGMGSNQGTGALTGIQILPASGTITSGKFRLYGIANS